MRSPQAAAVKRALRVRLVAMEGLAALGLGRYQQAARRFCATAPELTWGPENKRRGGREGGARFFFTFTHARANTHTHMRVFNNI